MFKLAILYCYYNVYCIRETQNQWSSSRSENHFPDNLLSDGMARSGRAVILSWTEQLNTDSDDNPLYDMSSPTSL